MLIKLLKNDKWGSWRHHNWNKTMECNWKGFLLEKHGWTRAHLLQQLRVISFNGAPRLWLLASTQIPGTCSSAGNTESICCPRNPPRRVLDICGNSGMHPYNMLYGSTWHFIIWCSCCAMMSHYFDHSINPCAKTSPWSVFWYPTAIWALNSRKLPFHLKQEDGCGDFKVGPCI